MQQDMILYTAAQYELDLLEVFEEVGHGEVYLVTMEIPDPVESVRISQRTKNFFLTLKRIKSFNRVTVYDREPHLAEYRNEIRGYRCLSKLKF